MEASSDVIQCSTLVLSWTWERGREREGGGEGRERKGERGERGRERGRAVITRVWLMKEGVLAVSTHTFNSLPLLRKITVKMIQSDYRSCRSQPATHQPCHC